MAVSVVVVSYRPEPWLGRCLASVAGQADEIVVVDNASAGGAASAIGRDAGATVVALPANAGFAGGVNAGIRAARGDHVALLNDDAFAEPGWLAGAVDTLRDPTVAAVSPKLLFAWPRAVVSLRDPVHHAPGDPRPLGRRLQSVTVDGVEVLGTIEGSGLYPDEGGWRWTDGDARLLVPLVGGGGRPTPEVRVDGEPVAPDTVRDLVNNAGSYLALDGAAGDIGFEQPDDGRYDEPGDRFAACGAAMVVRADAFARLGLFADELFTYYEDVDWCWRAQLAGLRVRYEPAGIVRHVHAATSDSTSARFHYYAQRNRFLCLARNAPLAVLARQLRAAGLLPPGVRRSLARRVPIALAQRGRLARGRRRSPAEVWARWAGVHAPSLPAAEHA